MRFIPMQDFHKLSSKFLIQLALFSCRAARMNPPGKSLEAAVRVTVLNLT